MLNVRPYVFVSPEYATGLPASASESIVKYQSPCPRVHLRASSEQHGNTLRGHDSGVHTASSRASAAAAGAASAAGRHAGVGGSASGSETAGSNATPSSQRERGAAPAEGVPAAAPERLRRPHAPLRCRPDDAAVLQLLLPSALVPVDLSLHSSLPDLAHGESRTALRWAAMGAPHAGGAKGAETSGLGCFSHPLARATAAEPVLVVPSAARARTGASPTITALGTASHKHAVRTSALLQGGLPVPSGKGELPSAGPSGGGSESSVRLLDAPAVLVGDGGEEWLQLAPAALRLWEQVSLEGALTTYARRCAVCAWHMPAHLLSARCGTRPSDGVVEASACVASRAELVPWRLGRSFRLPALWTSVRGSALIASERRGLGPSAFHPSWSLRH